MFSDEATSYVSGHVNRYEIGLLDSKNRHVTCEHILGSPKGENLVCCGARYMMKLESFLIMVWICNINLMDRIHCLKCLSHNVSGVESTPVFR